MHARCYIVAGVLGQREGASLKCNVKKTVFDWSTRQRYTWEGVYLLERGGIQKLILLIPSCGPAIQFNTC